MNNKLFGTALFALGTKIYRSTITANILQGTIENKRQAIVGIITTGAGIYVLGRSDGFQKGYNAGSRDTFIFLSTMSKKSK